MLGTRIVCSVYRPYTCRTDRLVFKYFCARTAIVSFLRYIQITPKRGVVLLTWPTLFLYAQLWS